MSINLIKKKETPKVEEDKVDGMLDMVIAFDTTGSMASYIKAVRKHVMELIPKLFAANPKLKISIVAFGDYCDMNSKSDFGNAYQVIDLTDNEDALIKFVKNARDTSGGVSRDGKYRCMDMDITRTDKETGERLVNINTISQLIYNGTKYIVD